MCGFVGVVHLAGRAATESADGRFLRAACARLALRGPDDEKFFYADNVGLGFRRLSIVDLADGAQPLFNEDDSIVLLTNGEIYNHRDVRAGLHEAHRFRTASDCEVLVHAYEELGVDFVQPIIGMFATALFDRRRKRLLLVRDRLGIKPLFLYRNRDTLVFASEIKALLAHPDVPREIDWPAALTTPYVAPPLTGEPPPPSFFRSIEHVPAAHMIDVDLTTGAITMRRYWDPEQARASNRLRSSSEFVEAYRETLRDSVRLRLMADVEYGLFLSGGIDSVSIARFASDAQPFHTFTVLSQSTLGNGDAEHAFAAARAFNLPNHQVLFDWKADTFAPADWKRVLWLTETPFANAEFLYKYYLHAFAKRLRPGLKMILLGQGSDEFNGGYARTYIPEGREKNWQNFLVAFDDLIVNAHLRQARAPAATLRLGDPEHLVVQADALAALGGNIPQSHPWRAYCAAHLRSLQFYNLWHEDRTAAAHGIENRVPFLDHRLVELCHSVPEALWPDLFWDKTILRRAMEGLIPEALRVREKVPFFFGEDVRYTRRMMYTLLRADHDALVEEAVAAMPDVLDADGIHAVLDGLPDDPEMEAIDPLLRAINVGLLQAMARADAPLVEHANPHPVHEVIASDWSEMKEKLGVELVARTPDLTLESVVAFVPGVLLVRCTGGDPGASDVGSHYVLVGNALTYIIEPRDAAWATFLEQVDGKRTVGAVLEDTGISRADRADVWKHLEESVEHRVLEVV